MKHWRKKMHGAIKRTLLFLTSSMNVHAAHDIVI